MTLGGLVEDWKDAWRWFSVQGLAVLALCPILYENFNFLQEFISASSFRWAMGALGLLTLISRIVKQK